MARTIRVRMVTVFASLLFSLTHSVYADFSGKVVGVLDGDSIRVMHNGKAEQVRLQGIDCPEKKQAFGTTAKQFTSEMVFGKGVTVKETGRDRYGRTLGDVVLPDGRNLNHEILKAGYAWWYRQYSKDARLGDMEDEARLARRGLWAESEPVPPWEWRTTMRDSQKRSFIKDGIATP
jgi:endonuclease YncB( thermonuclease family)